jgi:hypothetical protein
VLQHNPVAEDACRALLAENEELQRQIKLYDGVISQNAALTAENESLQFRVSCLLSQHPDNAAQAEIARLHGEVARILEERPLAQIRPLRAGVLAGLGFFGVPILLGTMAGIAAQPYSGPGPLVLFAIIVAGGVSVGVRWWFRRT